MLPVILSMLLTAPADHEGQAKADARALIETIEALQRPLDDFRCEFEGTIRYKGNITATTPVGSDGLYESYGGVFVWRRGGDARSEGLHRRAVDGRITRESLAVRLPMRQAEQASRLDDAPLAATLVKDPKQVPSRLSGCPRLILLLDEIKLDVDDEGMEATVSDGEIDGRPLKVLTIALKGVPGPFCRYWVDLGRNGHVVRLEKYGPGEVMSGRLDIALAPFKVDDAKVWMPVSGVNFGYVDIVDKKPVVTDEPTSIEKLEIIDGTMRFNERPGLEVFTIRSRLGSPTTDRLRELEAAFRRQTIAARPTMAKTQGLPGAVLSEGEGRTAGPVADDPSRGVDWPFWLGWGLIALGVIASVAYWGRRGRRRIRAES